MEVHLLPWTAPATAVSFSVFDTQGEGSMQSFIQQKNLDLDRKRLAEATAECITLKKLLKAEEAKELQTSDEQKPSVAAVTSDCESDRDATGLPDGSRRAPRPNTIGRIRASSGPDQWHRSSMSRTLSPRRPAASRRHGLDGAGLAGRPLVRRAFAERLSSEAPARPATPSMAQQRSQVPQRGGCSSRK